MTYKKAEVESHSQVALAFLSAYWRRDLASALEFCAPVGVIELARSLPIATPAPISVVLPLMYRDVYVRFEEQRFDAEVISTLSEGDRVLVEYVARGRLTNGCPFECGYAVVFDFESHEINKIRVYADTRYVAAMLIA